MNAGADRYAQHLYFRYRVILGYSGPILIIAGALILSPLALLPVYPRELLLAPAFLVPGLSLFLFGLLVWRRLGPRVAVGLTIQEGSTIVVLTWFLTLVVGAFPFMLGMGFDFTLAVFESTSGWTTTGLSIVDVTAAPHLVLFYRSIMQLAGGAGLAIITLSALVGPLGSGISTAEGRAEQLVPHVRRSAEIVLALYLAYCTIGVLALRLAGMTWFDAVNHAFAALSTGGFSTRPESIGYWNDPVIESVVIVLMLLGTLNFVTSYTLLRGNFRAVLRNGELRLETFLILLAGLIVFSGVARDLYPLWTKQLRVSLFETVSALSTTGFSTVTYQDWNSLGWLVLILLMLVGGGTGSTAGAIKQYRIYVLYRAMLWEIRSLFLPKNTVSEPYLWQGEEKVYLTDARIRQVGLFVFLYIVTFFIGSMILAAHGFSVQHSLFEFASAVGTVGLSVGITMPDAPPGVLWTQTLGMALGRLEFLTIFVGVMKILTDMRVLGKAVHQRHQ